MPKTYFAAGLVLFFPFASVRADDDAVGAGRKIFLETAGDVGCASCHRPDASGDVGPNIRGMDEDTIRNALQGGVEDMEFIELTEREIGQVAAFLATLK